jgi:DNA-binding GntR family transcriptional regulator
MPTTLPVPKVARHRVVADVRRQILAGRWNPGSKLPQEAIAKELGVSRIVVREALFELEASGLVDLTDHCGATVRRVDPKHLIECMELRELLDGLAARHCCNHMTLAELRAMREMAEEIRRLHLAGNRREGALVDRRFHLRLIEICDHALLQRLTRAHALPEKSTTFKRVDHELTYQDHVGILDAIAAGDPDRAETVARGHVRRGREQAEQELRRDGGAEIESIV